MSEAYRSWGLDPQTPQKALRWGWRDAPATQMAGQQSVLPFGNGRSYGDSCLNTAGTLIDARGLDRFVALDTDTGVLTAEAGLTFQNILQHIVPRGWFLPVTPGTQFLTLGGAIANDVHGKNHHVAGTIGRHIKQFELLRSDGSRLVCSATQNAELFAATIGGLGLTGLILSAEIQLIRVDSAFMDVETIPFNGLEAFRSISADSASFDYTVAWLDCVSGGENFARGLFYRARHAAAIEADELLREKETGKGRVSIPFNFPAMALNGLSIKLFNELYYRSNSKKAARSAFSRDHYQPYFYPLDSIANWNRIYGSKGFYQCQFVVPAGSESLEAILRAIVDSGMGSFLAVLKEFGDLASPGLLSFPRPGLCLALDFSNRGLKSRTLIERIEQQVVEAGGAIYPAKDRLMSASAFRTFFPAHDQFSRWIDPAFSSDFWRRVSMETQL
ncbi:FAD-binding oxidoreductase [Allohahella marinimesophila]|uniref:FAD-binding oxidoreductase n=1 Tax=Allohahella marinimesophila TaxID=1054972 RepID=A0ABP7Q9M1_9GAMM